MSGAVQYKPPVYKNPIFALRINRVFSVKSGYPFWISLILCNNKKIIQ